ncbi:MAG: TldD/PmbA family protein [Cyanobacteria bacterium NC_groundwater_1444_Ag_S-0.65um_54_12]|nr:TldD/PmbA family protein [Cyanobacteria bacterium NC_groundwater_1444_Ag_S-0.65um_54_12]
MQDLVHRALNTAQVLGASYADVRFVHSEIESIAVKDGKVAGISSEESRGYGIRVLWDGAWGFAASSQLAEAEVDRVVEQAISIAKASRLAQHHPVALGNTVTSRGSYETPVSEDPFLVPLEEKLAILLAADAAMGTIKGIRTREASLGWQRQTKLFANTEGAWVEQKIVETGGGIEATAVSPDNMQRRSYPNSYGRHTGTGGFELIRASDLPGHALQIAEEAVALIVAPPCPEMVTTLVLDSSQMALQIHESIGHAIELDRVLGWEASFAGTSFLKPDLANNFRYGSELINVTANATTAGGLGTFGFDDEGIPAQVTPIIRDGIFLNFITSRETATALNGISNGTMRADSWNHIPLIRMTNINLEPGTFSSLEALLDDVKEGVFLQTNKSWSIDDRRLNFQFGTEIAREIKNGKLGRILCNPVYSGITPGFWASCDGLGDRSQWRMWGTLNCGKGQPCQMVHVGHGTSPGRFRNVQLGIKR